MKNAVIKSLYESFNKSLNESYEYWTEEDWANKLQDVCNLSIEETDDLLHDLNNLRGDEWLEIVEDNCNDEELLIAFKKFIGAEDSVEESLSEDYNSDLQIEREVQKYLDDHDLWGDVSVHDGVVSVEIHWGDWKHDHWYCQDLMNELGYTLINKVVTEEDGSDTFSAIHTYEKMKDIDESMNDKQFPEFKDWLEQEYYPGFDPSDLSDEEYYELEDLYHTEKEKFEEK